MSQYVGCPTVGQGSSIYNAPSMYLAHHITAGTIAAAVIRPRCQLLTGPIRDCVVFPPSFFLVDQWVFFFW